LIVLAGVLASPVLLFADATYIGAGKCKLCHKVQYASWQELKHAGAFDLLPAEEQANPECLSCHATGASAELPGVQCEACHGPGSEYNSIKVMKDRDASLSAGLELPGEATCKGCHEKAPHELPPFDFAAARAAGIHEFKNPR
jgi:nitrate/TMAO reductase-like tetraheme cytochrome c subunit